MAPASERSRGDTRTTTIIDGWPTGAKVFLILSVALLPLAIIAIFATLKTTQLATSDARARLRVAAAESSRALTIELVGDMTALRTVVDALSRDPVDTASCARVQGVFAPQFTSGTRFVVLDRAGRALCGQHFAGDSATASKALGNGIAARIDSGAGLQLAVGGRNGLRGAAMFPRGFLDRISRPSGLATPYGTTLLDGAGRTLGLHPLEGASTFDRHVINRTRIGIDSLSLELRVPSPPITSPLVIAMLLPLVMWLSAASIAWFVVDRLLIRPLRALRSSVAAFQPGTEIDPAATRGIPAQEIRELGETFRAISQTVAIHEAGLAAGLNRQTKLTREVHHRVKNNLQVIASLISLHARSARNAEAGEAYASIQRRVDALAVVHRNHFAEIEENRGLSLRAMIGELSSNLRATAASDLGIIVDVEPLWVNQDVAVAIAFLLTETIELALTCDPSARVRISGVAAAEPDRATIRISSPALVDGDALQARLAGRYARVLEGLSRQLRAKLHHDPLVGAFEITIPTIPQE